MDRTRVGLVDGRNGKDKSRLEERWQWVGQVSVGGTVVMGRISVG